MQKDLISANRSRLDVGGMHWKRAYRMLTFVNFLAIGLGITWGIYAVMQPNMLITCLAVTVLITAILMFRLIAVGQVKLASYTFISVVFLILCLTAKYLGILHQFFLPLAVCSFLLMRNEILPLKHGMPLLCLAAFGWYCCAPLDLAGRYVLPITIREPALWFNQIFSGLAAYICMHLAYEDVLEENIMEIELRDALLNKEFLIFYQPQVSGRAEIIGVEALLRWQHPTRGLVPPNNFIPTAESSGLMIPIGEWILRAACEQLEKWRLIPGFEAISIAINVSASQFAEEQFVNKVLKAVKETGIEPSLLKIELTESMLVANIDATIEKMALLKDKGIRFSLDDFGTGFSSLSYLRQLPLDQIKVDQSFVRNLLKTPADAAVTKTIIALGNELNLDVIAEGVETELHHTALVSMGCHHFQGYYFSRPITVADFELLVLSTQTETNSTT